jgi:hypothetical protein
MIDIPCVQAGWPINALFAINTHWMSEEWKDIYQNMNCRHFDKNNDEWGSH